MTREEAIKKWRNRVAGIIALGSSHMRAAVLGPKSSVTDLGEAIQHIGETADSLIGSMWDDFGQKPILANNGQKAQVEKR